MACKSEQKIVRLYVTSYARDFVHERHILFKEVIPDLRRWCEVKGVQIIDTDIRWGGQSKKRDLQKIQKDISEEYFEDVMPYFINLTSSSLGVVPLWGDASDAVIEEYKTRTNVTDAEMEILFGAYRTDSPNVIFCLRDDSFLEDLCVEEEKRYFVKRNLVSSHSRKQAQQLLQRYPAGQIFHHNYDCAGYDHCEAKMRVEMAPTFAKQILDKMKSRLEADFPSCNISGDRYIEMRQAQESFMVSHSARVRGRDDIVLQIEEYVRTGGKEVPLLLLGGAGSGKSSIMAKAANVLANKAKENQLPGGGETGWHVFYHFVGAVLRSTELQLMLRRLSRELDIVNESATPQDVSHLAQLICNALSNASTKPVVILVDALNQFDEDHAALVMSWVPRKLAPNVRCVFSMINDTPQHNTLMARESKPQELHMVPLSLPYRKQIVTEMMTQCGRQLSRMQVDRLLSKQTSENLLWLSVACEELRLVGEEDNLDYKIQYLPDGLLSLLEEVLDRCEAEHGGHRLVATLCLLEASATGLLQTELLDMLAEEDTLTPPSPYDEKEEKESSEKESSEKKKKTSVLSEEKWSLMYRALRPFLRPFGDSREGRLDFYHRALSKAVRRKYFKVGDDNESDEESQDIYTFWHKKLADYFEHCGYVNRKVEEYLYHLCKLDDKIRLGQCLCEWSVFDKLYNDEYSGQLLAYWRKTGGSTEMITHYKAALEQLEEKQPRDEHLIALRYEHIARIFLQAGKYEDSLELTKVATKLEEKELGNRTERMVELYGLMAEIFDEKLKLNDFVSPSQLPDLRKTISYGRKSIDIRKSIEGDYHKFKLGMSLMKLAFSLESWEACGGDGELSGEDALKEGNEHIDRSLLIFKELKDEGHYAEALMTKGVLAQRGSMVQLKYYNEAMDICMQVYGEKSLLTSRLYINIGIVYEDNKDYVKAFEYFRKWAEVSEVVLGPDHPKTLRAKGVLKEPRYKLVALRLKQHDEDGNNEQSENQSVDEEQINQEVENLDEIDDDHYNHMMNSDEERVLLDGEFPGDVSELQELYQAFNDLLRRATQATNDHIGLDVGDNREDEHVDIERILNETRQHLQQVQQQQLQQDTNTDSQPETPADTQPQSQSESQEQLYSDSQQQENQQSLQQESSNNDNREVDDHPPNS